MLEEEQKKRLSDKELESIRARFLASAQSDWMMVEGANSDIAKIVIGDGRWKDFTHHLVPNAKFIVCAHGDIPRLLNEVEALKEERDASADDNEACHRLLDEVDPENIQEGFPQEGTTSCETLETRLRALLLKRAKIHDAYLQDQTT